RRSVAEDHAHAAGVLDGEALVGPRVGTAVAEDDLPGDLGRVERRLDARRDAVDVTQALRDQRRVHAGEPHVAGVDQRRGGDAGTDAGTGVDVAVTGGGGTDEGPVGRARGDGGEPRRVVRDRAGPRTAVAGGRGDEDTGVGSE